MKRNEAKAPLIPKDDDWKSSRLGVSRREYLMARIRKIEQAAWNGPAVPLEPAAVKKARELIERHEHEVYVKRNELQAEIGVVVEEAKKAVLFAESAADALTAVERLYDLARKKRWILS